EGDPAAGPGPGMCVCIMHAQRQRTNNRRRNPFQQLALVSQGAPSDWQGDRPLASNPGLAVWVPPPYRGKTYEKCYALTE
ncbi:hypothetical protein N9L68_07765, partial [bacterium]|nr:hypothetical protein [bacterium]